MTFHPGRVLKTIHPDDKDVESSDESAQATVQMWDGNLFTFLIKEEIQDKVNEGSIVLVDYRPIGEGKMPVANQKIVKVLQGQLAQEVWKRYQDFQDNRQQNSSQTSPIQQPSYMG